MLDNKLQLYFPQIIQQIGWLLLLFGFLSFIRALPVPNLIVPAVGMLVGVALSWTYQGAQLDLAKKKIRVYVGIFGLKVGSWNQLPEIREIVFTSSNYAQQIHSWVSRSQLNTKLYKAFLKGPQDYKQLFSSERDRNHVLKQVKSAAEAFGLPAINYTTKPPTRIN